jgi:alkanesulfonate monooxygenase SsuD/methylene tetrahydromethanopterin reductase-like flavin-dependent oxidoreductase (luciferase family)
MRLGLYFDLRNPPGWQRPWADHYARSLEWMQEAEARGIDSIWVTEHHFFADGYLPQPLTLAAAIAARTRRVRIGTAVMLAPLRPAVQIAEEAAIVDLLSNGRLDLGLGAGYSIPEFEAYGADPATRFATCDARIAEVRRLLEEDGITPPPVQRPFPIWAGYLGPVGARRAGRLGVGLLSLSRNLHEPYLKGLAEAGHPASSARMAAVQSFLLSDDPERDFERVLPYLTHQLNSYRRAGSIGTGKLARDLTVEDVRKRPGSGPLSSLQVVSAAEAARQLRESTAGLPAVECYLWASIGGMPDDMVERHLELCARELRPLLARP